MKINKKYCRLIKNKRLLNLSIPIIGLTGGIATGKSTVANILIKEGWNIISADKLVKSIYKHQDTNNFIHKNYPQVIKEGIINFNKLRNIAFSNNSIRKNIEQFIYSKMPQEFLIAFKKLTNPLSLIYDVPLLFEKGLYEKVDISVCVYSNYQIQLDRLINRDSIDRVLATKMLSSQLNTEEKVKLSDFIIENNSDFETLRKNTKNIFNQLRN